MTPDTIDQAQRKAARVVGLTYLLALIPANFAEFYVPSRLIVYDNAAETARNIMAHERLFRLGIASNLIVFAIDVVLITALYVVLERVDRNLALLSTFFRLVETAIMVVVTLSDFDVLRILSGAAYLRPFEPERLHALARLSIGAHGAGYNLGLLFFGLGSTVFGYLWFKSNYIPRGLAVLGVVSALLVAVSSFAFIIFPDLTEILIPGCYLPIFLFEVIMGFWLLLKRLPPARAAIDGPRAV